MKKLLVASLIATTSMFVALPTAPATAAVGSISQDKADKVDKEKKAKKDKADKVKKAKKSAPPKWGLNPLKRGGNVALAALPDSDKVTICHRTNSDTNPYVQITPATAGVANGHDGHAGPIYTPALAAAGTKWGDIIPPYVFRGVQYPGQNWTAEGQALYNNGCDVPNEVLAPPIVVATVAPSVVPPTCEADGRLILPADENVFYTSAPAGTGPGVHTVTATPEVEHVLIGDTQWVLEVEPQLTGDDCAAVAGAFASAASAPDDDALLPDTGGVVWWLLVVGGLLTAAGAALAVGSRRRT